jgi:hypothetical protein
MEQYVGASTAGNEEVNFRQKRNKPHTRNMLLCYAMKIFGENMTYQ